MNWKLTAAAVGLSLFAATGVARADGELNIYNWGNYTSPDLIKKFEETYKVKVTVTDYDSNDTALAKVRQGASGYDIVVPSASVVPIWISEGLLLETDPNKMDLRCQLLFGQCDRNGDRLAGEDFIGRVDGGMAHHCDGIGVRGRGNR